MKGKQLVTAWFEKELVDSPIYIMGRAYRFHLLETQDAGLIQHLTNAAKNHVGGIIRLTQEEYDKKKAAPSPASLRLRGEREEVRQKVFSSPLNRKRGASVADNDKPQGAATPTQAVQDVSSFVPTTARGVFE